ncbi:MAG: methylated-DNA--[protein]-cysteine S-methyltransferase [Bacteroidales bacterium]|jgi:methylated-DNA-[protein]-cysteine S-methyltransferase|nr:methylated-DNA--[protein]-cysteine S-methyltransferase [Bacteroidales bacterium]
MSDKIAIAHYMSPIGLVEIHSSDNKITALFFCNDSHNDDQIGSELLKKCISQLDEYFKGERIIFDLPLYQEGTEFQQKVWNALLDIPFGNTATYADIAQKIGNSKAVRAVGTTNGKNQLWLVVPCHRIIGSDGSLTGYAGGIERKKWLLDHEARISRKLGLTIHQSIQLELF